MRWLHVAAGILSVLAMTGCPSEFGKDGRIDEAVEKDSKERLLELTSCSEQYRHQVCDPPHRDEVKCKRCGG